MDPPFIVKTLLHKALEYETDPAEVEKILERCEDLSLQTSESHKTAY